MTTGTDILTARRAYVRLSRPIHEEYAMASAMDCAMCPDGYGRRAVPADLLIALADLEPIA